jgi:hypothetical protein
VSPELLGLAIGIAFSSAQSIHARHFHPRVFLLFGDGYHPRSKVVLLAQWTGKSRDSLLQS